MLRYLFSHSLYTFHACSMTFTLMFPLFPWLIEVKYKNKKIKKTKIYFGLVSITSSILFSYYLFDNICLLSCLENYINSKDYSVYRVEPLFKNTLYFSLFSNILQYFSHDTDNKLFLAFPYFGWLLYNSYTSLHNPYMRSNK